MLLPPFGLYQRFRYQQPQQRRRQYPGRAGDEGRRTESRKIAYLTLVQRGAGTANISDEVPDPQKVASSFLRREITSQRQHGPRPDAVRETEGHGNSEKLCETGRERNQ